MGRFLSPFDPSIRKEMLSQIARANQAGQKLSKCSSRSYFIYNIENYHQFITVGYR